MTAYQGPERRSGRERRHTHRTLTRQLFFPGKRSQVRRSEDRLRMASLDQYSQGSFAAIMAILVLSTADAFFTLILLGHGAVEINPIMAFYIRLGPEVFILTKYMLTAMAIVILVFLKDSLSHRYRYRLGRFFLPGVAALFGTVVVWQLYLIAKVSA